MSLRYDAEKLAEFEIDINMRFKADSLNYRSSPDVIMKWLNTSTGLWNFGLDGAKFGFTYGNQPSVKAVMDMTARVHRVGVNIVYNYAEETGIIARNSREFRCRKSLMSRRDKDGHKVRRPGYIPMEVIEIEESQRKPSSREPAVISLKDDEPFPEDDEIDVPYFFDTLLNLRHKERAMLKCLHKLVPSVFAGLAKTNLGELVTGMRLRYYTTNSGLHPGISKFPASCRADERWCTFLARARLWFDKYIPPYLQYQDGFASQVAFPMVKDILSGFQRDCLKKLFENLSFDEHSSADLDEFFDFFLKLDRHLPVRSSMSLKNQPLHPRRPRRKVLGSSLNTDL